MQGNGEQVTSRIDSLVWRRDCQCRSHRYVATNRDIKNWVVFPRLEEERVEYLVEIIWRFLHVHVHFHRKSAIIKTSSNIKGLSRSTSCGSSNMIIRFYCNEQSNLVRESRLGKYHAKVSLGQLVETRHCMSWQDMNSNLVWEYKREYLCNCCLQSAKVTTHTFVQQLCTLSSCSAERRNKNIPKNQLKWN